MGYVIDSNAVIDYMSGQMPLTGMAIMNAIVNQTPIISVITKIEVLGFNVAGETEQLLLDFISSSIVLPVNEEIVDATISLRKSIKIKTPDAIIAASAIVLKSTLVTRNTSDFKNIKGLKLLNPWTL